MKVVEVIGYKFDVFVLVSNETKDRIHGTELFLPFIIHGIPDGMPSDGFHGEKRGKITIIKSHLVAIRYCDIPREYIETLETIYV